jgi:Domain of unknown function (DUF4864)
MWQKLLACTIFVLALFAGGAMADALPEDTFKSIITHQLEAFAKDDGASAYSDAAPNVKAYFPTVESFMSMVQNGYQPVYRNKSYSFLGGGIDAGGRIYEKVQLQGADGITYQATYFMQQQDDGSWKISGCVILKGGETA